MNNTHALRWATALFVLPLVFAVERFAYYGNRATLYMWARQLAPPDADTDVYLSVFQIQMPWMFAGLALGGLLAFALGPRLMLVASGVGVAAAYIGLGGVESIDDMKVWLALMQMTVGGLKVSIFALAAHLLAQRLEQRLLFVVVLYLGINLAALVSSALATGLSTNYEGADGAMRVGLGILVGCAVLVGSVAVAVDKLTGEAMVEGEPRARAGRPFVFMAAGGAVLLPYWLGVDHFWAASSEVISDLGLHQIVGLINPVVVILATGGLVIVLVAILLGKNQTFPLVPVLVVGLGLGAVGLVTATPALAPTAILATVLLALAELVSPLLLGRLLTGARARVVPLLVAGWFMLSYAGGVMTSWMSWHVVVLVLSALGLVIAAVLAAVFGKQFLGWLDEPTPDPVDDSSFLNPQPD